jgi:hypothetical protein
MSFLRPMLKNRCTFNELEFRRMADNLTPFSKGDSAATTILLTTKLYKTTTKNEDQFDLLEYYKMILMKRAINFIIH